LKRTRKAKRRIQNRLAVLRYQKERAEQRHVTQGELAKYLGVSENTITNWMYNDVTIFDGNIIEGLCEYFGIGICDLLYFEDVPEDDDSPDKGG
jgi:transcriptional regulator with XRE-family HTH domain